MNRNERWQQAFIGIGSNMGNRRRSIELAIALLGQLTATVVVHQSHLIETQPVGGPPQGPFLNGVLEVHTTVDPYTLLNTLKGIERNIGRQPDPVRWGPRVIDLDILLYEQLVIDTGDLIIPHPLMHERAFVLEPFMEVAPAAVHPVFQKTIRQLWQELQKNSAAVKTFSKAP